MISQDVANRVLKTVVVLPTYNEVENIGQLIEALQLQANRMTAYELHLLIVDDNSPDGTAKIVNEKCQLNSNVHLISGDKRGLGAAYIRGIRQAIRVLKADIVIQMDADFSHDPEDVPRLLSVLNEGADFVIGSRYVSGGTLPKEWGISRRLNSFLGNIVARYVAGLYQIRDCTAGFRAIKTSLLKEIDLEGLRVKGYAFQVTLLYRAVALGGKIKEVPVHFADRVHGQSKLGIADIIEFIINAWWIRYYNSKIFIKFGLVGLSGVFVNLGVFSILIGGGISKYLASPIAIEVSIISNFFLNNFWTFRWRPQNTHIVNRAIKFNLVAFGTLVVSYSAFVVLSAIFPREDPKLFQLISIFPGLLINYFLNSRWTFKKNPLSTIMGNGR